MVCDKGENKKEKKIKKKRKTKRLALECNFGHPRSLCGGRRGGVCGG